MADESQTNWQDSGWLDQAHRWIHDELAQLGRSVSGAIEQIHLQPWSTVLKVPTASGDVFFKASSGALAFEPALTQALYRWRSDCIPEVLATDADQGWMIMTDGGQRTREAFAVGLGIEHWSSILSSYASLQITLAGHIDELLSLGVRDRRLAVLQDLFAKILTDEDWFLIDRAEGISRSEYRRLSAGSTKFTEMCRELASYQIPESLHHNDLHDGNIFSNDGRILIFDWGDSSVSHPFFSMRTVAISMEYTFGLEEDDPRIAKIEMGYLEQWTEFETPENLIKAYDIAKRIASISTAVKYWTFLRQVDQIEDDFRDALPGLMKEFLDANPSF